MSDKPKLPGSLNTDARLDSWIIINDDRATITIKTGKVEYGQGVITAIAQIAAEELDVTVERIRIKTADTGETVNERLTAGSGSIEESGAAIRYAGAHAKSLLLDMAAAALSVETESLSVEDGTIKSSATNTQTTYWELLGGKTFDADITGKIPPKDPVNHTIVGNPVIRIDIADKVTGTPAFIQDMDIPGLLHGRILRPPSYDAQLKKTDIEGARALPGVVDVILDGRFIGIIAEREDQAVHAWNVLGEATTWDETATLPNEDQLYDWLVSQETDDYLVVDGVPEDQPIPEITAPDGAASTLEAVYGRPYQSHASIGPSSGMAVWEGDNLKVWSHSQGIYPLQAALSCAFGIDAEKIRCIAAENAGCYGHNGADDAAMDAAVLARTVPGRTVRVHWMREDENRWEPLGSAQVMMTQASLDNDGNIMDWNFDVWSNAHAGRPRAKTETAGFIALWHKENPVPPPPPGDNQGKDGGAHRGARPYYDLPNQRIAKHFVKPHPFRVSSLRALGTFGNLFATESFMDELAHEAGIEAIEFRLRHTKDPRARAVIEAVAKAANWDPSSWRDGQAQGFAFNRYKNSKCYAAVIFDVNVDRKTGVISIPKAYIGGDCGQIINPDGVANQLEGGLIQAASWTLKEAVRFDPVRITSIDWETYPILNFKEVPEIDVVLLDHKGEKPMGVGEATQGPTPAAIANGVFNATGVRMRELPLTPDRVLSMLSGGT